MMKLQWIYFLARSVFVTEGFCFFAPLPPPPLVGPFRCSSSYFLKGREGYNSYPSLVPTTTTTRLLAEEESSSTTLQLGPLSPPPPPPALFRPKPLPILLAGGLFLFGSSIPRKDQALAKELLQVCQEVLQTDPTVTMELGQGIETGGVYASLRTTTTTTTSSAPSGTVEFEQIMLQFQIEGGNAWAQGIAYGVRPLELITRAGNDNNKSSWEENGNAPKVTQLGSGTAGIPGPVQLVSLQVANMDASINGAPFDVPIPASVSRYRSWQQPQQQ